MSAQPRLAGIELGGTKAIAVLALGQEIVDTLTIPTGEMIGTLGALRQQLGRWDAIEPLQAIGIASFGPVQLDRTQPHYGTILATPKAGWSGAPVADLLTGGLDCPWSIDTDVNGAVLAEYQNGAGIGCDPLCYITLGTGVGGGLLIGGRPVHGAMHPELGHLRLRRAPGDSFAGVCPFHGDCIEGLVSGPALAARFGGNAAAVPNTHPGWDDVASDIAALCGAILLTTAAKRILFGGSIALHRTFLLPRVRTRLVEALGSYLPYLTAETATDIVQVAGLGSEAGPLGAIALAADALERARR
ncbi:ROK family protein [Sphingomonas sp. ASY06-1R]|uniref:ROK family protein n=1 Tax=Sphingomonas sp. ASY06-1R TaxID=3445771 RepID=UPI003FA31905